MGKRFNKCESISLLTVCDSVRAPRTVCDKLRSGRKCSPTNPDVFFPYRVGDYSELPYLNGY